ncbi:ribonuclease mar1, putative [Bodo saltans]|uniref:Ribonuclease mar1, putative n=1 Tax=Bodo saltans TaxID=75058 RepID=A0A0S4IVV9_BODSA|nr:ribonuclease mar1, putative [Bodo saltans]|eukprot:CUF22104.1 ribonuclease mar1, putative [Bodo saltans]
MSRLLQHYSTSRTAFFCCDLQTAFAPRISRLPVGVFVANRFAQLHTILPEATDYYVTEHYPKALGTTVSDIIIPSTAKTFHKKKFSMLTEELLASLEHSPVDQVVVFGVEAHVCVLQTVAELMELPTIKRVAVARDGVGSQKPGDEDAAIQLMQSWGGKCIVTTSESILFQLTRDAADPNFKAISSLAKQQAP